MPSSENYLEFILEQLSDLGDITYRKMMGEYILYYKGKIVGGIYDNKLLVKPTKTAVAYMPEVIYETPYDGAKEMLLVGGKLITKIFCQIFLMQCMTSCLLQNLISNKITVNSQMHCQPFVYLNVRRNKNERNERKNAYRRALFAGGRRNNRKADKMP